MFVFGIVISGRKELEQTVPDIHRLGRTRGRRSFIKSRRTYTVTVLSGASEAILYLCSKSTGAVTSCTLKYLASAGYFRATASYIAYARWGRNPRSQILRLQPGILGNLLQRDRAKLFAVMPCPCVVGKSVSLKLHMGSFFLRSRLPADAEQGPVYADCFAARPRTHKKRMDFGDFLICSVRSAMTRRARAVTFTSASCSVVP